MRLLPATVDQDRRLRLARERSAVERVLTLAGHLPDDQAFLVQQALGEQRSLATLAKLTGRPRSTLQRRLQRIVRRLRGPMFAFLVTQADLLPRPVRRTCEALILQGLSQREAARATGQSLHTVRRHLAMLQTLARA